jgi:hypothetical protein
LQPHALEAELPSNVASKSRFHPSRGFRNLAVTDCWRSRKVPGKAVMAVLVSPAVIASAPSGTAREQRSILA